MNSFDPEYPFGDLLEDYKFDELSKFLQSNCQKKNTVNTMDESNIPMHDIIFRCGLQTKSLHNIFSYIFNSQSNDMRYGQNIDQWFFKQSNEIYGGIPPTLDNIKTEPELVNFFVDSMFFHRHKSHKKQSLRVFLLPMFLDFMMHLLELLGMNRLVSTSIQPIIPYITKSFPFLQKHKFQ